MTVVLILFALLPGVALAGPLLIGVAFDADWILRIGFGIDVAAVVLGGAACWIVRSASVRPGPGPPLGTSMATAVGVGLIGFGILFGGITAWRLFVDSGK